MENKQSTNNIEENVDLNKDVELNQETINKTEKKKVVNKKLYVILGLVLLIGVSLSYLLSLNKNEEVEETEVTIQEEIVEEPLQTIEEEIIEEQIVEEEDNQSGKYASFKGINYANLDESSWLIKYEDDSCYSIAGIDVSEFNGVCNFYTLKNSGYDFVMLRVGWRGYTEGGIYEDKYFEEYYKEAKDAGLKIGFYFFSQAINEDEAIEEANFLLERIQDKECDMFVAYDMESIGQDEGRIYYTSNAEKTNCALAFMNAIENAGYKPMLYVNNDWASNYYYMDDFSEIPIWYAQYDDYPNVSFDFQMWQYTAKASISGSSLIGRTDINLMLINK